MPKSSAGILAYRLRAGAAEFFLVHPGGPFWAKKDLGAWTIPKGEFQAEESPASAARREFLEETGICLSGPLQELGTIRQAGGKVVHAFLAAADFEADKIVSNTFKLEWPPRSGRFAEFPEVDRAGWFTAEAATPKLNPAQLPFLTRASEIIHEGRL
jgi:predicted NUDIX family NTP pyrophosphohydrolase